MTPAKSMIGHPHCEALAALNKRKRMAWRKHRTKQKKVRLRRKAQRAQEPEPLRAGSRGRKRG